MNKIDRKIFVISGPSGVGKGTVVSQLTTMRHDIKLSVSATTRSPRLQEVDGVNYFFKTQEAFEGLIQSDQLLEWAEFAGNYYGTLKEEVQSHLHKGFHVILEIEVQGAMQVKSLLPDAVMIFISPPSRDVVRERLVGRHTESEESVAKRLSIMDEELKYIKYFDYNIVNDNLEEAVTQLNAIISSFECLF